MRITVHPVGRRNVGFPHCTLCGSKRALRFGVCVNQCFWMLPGWVGYNAVLNKIVFVDSRALPLAKLHKWNPVTKRRSAPSFLKLVAIARSMGWNGDTAAMSQPTFVGA